jgi:hypothetical protein
MLAHRRATSHPLRDALFRAEEKLLIHKWHLEKLAPKA